MHAISYLEVMMLQVFCLVHGSDVYVQCLSCFMRPCWCKGFELSTWIMSISMTSSTIWNHFAINYTCWHWQIGWLNWCLLPLITLWILKFVNVMIFLLHLGVRLVVMIFSTLHIILHSMNSPPTYDHVKCYLLPIWRMSISMTSATIWNLYSIDYTCTPFKTARFNLGLLSYT